jgi:hypothetical protein
MEAYRLCSDEPCRRRRHINPGHSTIRIAPDFREVCSQGLMPALIPSPLQDSLAGEV